MSYLKDGLDSLTASRDLSQIWKIKWVGPGSPGFRWGRPHRQHLLDRMAGQGWGHLPFIGCEYRGLGAIADTDPSPLLGSEVFSSSVVLSSGVRSRHARK